MLIAKSSGLSQSDALLVSGGKNNKGKVCNYCCVKGQYQM